MEMVLVAIGSLLAIWVIVFVGSTYFNRNIQSSVPSASTQGCSAPAPRIGTLALAVLAACGLSLRAVGVTQRRFSRSIRKLVELRAADMPDAAWAASGHPPS
jgi:hypothetical protein